MIAGNARALARLSFLTLALGCAAASYATAAQLKGYGVVCPEKQQICFWMQAVVTPPKGWIEAGDWSQRYRGLFLFENGDRSTDKPLMYVNVEAPRKGETPEQIIEVSQKDWKKRSKGSTVEKLPDFERKNKPGFKVFLYRNPSNPEQAFELTAFMQDVDAAHPERSYFFEAVLVSPDKEELEKSKVAFYELLANL